MRLSRFWLIPATILLVAACSPGRATPLPSASSVRPGPSADAQLSVTLTDGFRIEPASMTVPVGVPVTFLVTNEGVIEHEFYLGDEQAQAEHELEMAEMGGMTHDEPEGIAVKPGETKALTYTFDVAGEILAGCHVVGHYGAGMKAEIKVG